MMSRLTEMILEASKKKVGGTHRFKIYYSM